MKNEDITQEYKTFLEGLEKVEFKTLLDEFKRLKEDKTKSYKEKGLYLNKVSCDDLNKILFSDEYLKIFYLDPQAKYILNKLGYGDLSTLGSLVYEYNDQCRTFKEKVESQKLSERMKNEGFTEVKLMWRENDELIKIDLNELKKLSGLKVKCVLDRDKIGLLGSYTQTEEHEGRLFYHEQQERLYFIPKRHTKTGQLLTSKFYYKVIDGI